VGATAVGITEISGDRVGEEGAVVFRDQHACEFVQYDVR